MERENTEGRITVLLSLTSEPAIFPEPKDGNFRRWGFKGTTERLSSITLMDRTYIGIPSGFLSAFSPGSLWDKGFSTERRAVRSFYFRDFRLDFMGLPGFCGGNEDRVRRTVSYADTVLQAHVQTKASAAT